MGEAAAVIAVVNAAVIAGVNIDDAIQKISQQIIAARASGATLTIAQLSQGFSDNDAVFTAINAQLAVAAQTPSG